MIRAIWYAGAAIWRAGTWTLVVGAAPLIGVLTYFAFGGR